MSRSFFLVATFLTECLIYQQTFKVIFGDGMIGYVIGDSDMITGFKLVGVEGAEASTADEARQALHKALTRTSCRYHYKRSILRLIPHARRS